MPADLDSQIAGIFAQLSSDPLVWLNLTKRFQADLFCGLFLRDGNEGIQLSPETMAAIADRRLLIDFDIYSYGHDSEERF